MLTIKRQNRIVAKSKSFEFWETWIWTPHFSGSFVCDHKQTLQPLWVCSSSVKLEDNCLKMVIVRIKRDNTHKVVSTEPGTGNCTMNVHHCDWITVLTTSKQFDVTHSLIWMPLCISAVSIDMTVQKTRRGQKTVLQKKGNTFDWPTTSRWCNSGRSVNFLNAS